MFKNNNTKKFTDANFVKVAGNMTNPAHLDKTTNGKDVAYFTIGNDTGGKYPSYFSIRAYNANADAIGNQGYKGMFVYVPKGQLQSYRKSIEGAKYKVTVTYINAWELRLYPSKKNGNQAPQGQQNQQPANNNANQNARQPQNNNAPQGNAPKPKQPAGNAPKQPQGKGKKPNFDPNDRKRIPDDDLPF